MRDVSALPKAELHIHLEGSIRVETVRDLARRQGLATPSALHDDGWWRFDGFLHFLDQYGAVCNLLNDLEDFRRVGYEFCEDLAGQGVRYAEAVFSPAQHAGRLGDWHGPIEAVLDGLAAGERDFGTTCRLEPDIIRDFGMELAEGSLEVAIRHVGEGVVALNCAGSERFPVEPYEDLFRRAADAGLRSTPHAGEWSGPASVHETLRYLRPDRIGHGVRAIEDPELLKALADRRIPLEVCPSSNVATGVYPTLEEHPFPRLRAAGVIATLNSDDPALFGSWVADEYRIAREVFGYDDAELAQVARDGIESSFADGAVKASILDAVDAWLAAEPEPAAT